MVPSSGPSLLSALISCLLLAVGSGVAPASDKPLKVFILAGQSNMSGHDDLSDSVPSGHPRAFVFGNDYRWRQATEPLPSWV